MRIKEVTVGASRTINLGNYNSLKVEGRATLELDEGEDTADHLAVAREIGMAEVKEQLKYAYEQLKPKK
jgi:hypothetical protein